MENHTDNPMEAYTIQMLKTDVKKGATYLCNCWFLLFSIGITVVSHMVGAELVFDTVKDFQIMLVIALALIGLGYVTISHDLKQIKKKQKKIKLSQVVMIAIFLYMTMATEVIFFVIDFIILMANASGVETMIEDAGRLGVQTQMMGIVVLFNYPIFFKGKEIWKWIIIRDEKIEQYEKELEDDRITQCFIEKKIHDN